MAPICGFLKAGHCVHWNFEFRCMQIHLNADRPVGRAGHCAIGFQSGVCESSYA